MILSANGGDIMRVRKVNGQTGAEKVKNFLFY